MNLVRKQLLLLLAIAHGLLDEGLVDALELDVKDQVRPRWDTRRLPLLAVSVRPGDQELHSLPNAQLAHTVVPALDDTAHSELEGEGVAALSRAVEHLPATPATRRAHTRWSEEQPSASGAADLSDSV